jgi:hypothetical protein
MPIRNPFAKKADPPYASQPNDENATAQSGILPTFEKVDTIGSKASSALSISSKQSQEPPEYKMSGMDARRTVGENNNVTDDPSHSGKR